MEKANHIVASFLIFALVVALSSSIYSELQDIYGFTSDGDDINGTNVMERLSNIDIITGMKDIETGLYKTTLPTSNFFDVLGALKTTALGFYDVVTGIIVFPVTILGVVTDFYTVPPMLKTVTVLLFIIYIAFIILRNRGGSE